jgi:hypothetical protein
MSSRSKYKHKQIFIERPDGTFDASIGMLDCDGRIIYCGDIIACYNYEGGYGDNIVIAEIIYQYKWCQYTLEWVSGVESEGLFDREIYEVQEWIKDGDYFVKVIGNAYEDKHLLDIKPYDVKDLLPDVCDCECNCDTSEKTLNDTEKLQLKIAQSFPKMQKEGEAG